MCGFYKVYEANKTLLQKVFEDFKHEKAFQNTIVLNLLKQLKIVKKNLIVDIYALNRIYKQCKMMHHEVRFMCFSINFLID